MLQRPLFRATLAAVLLGAAPIAAPPPPPVVPVKEFIFGYPVIDRYRYFENDRDPRTKAFYARQGAYTREVLAQLGQARERLGERIRQLDRSSVSVSEVMRAGGLYFYERQARDDESPKLYARAVTGGKPRLLVDPTKGAIPGIHRSIDWYIPSFDGSRVVYGISSGGSENSVLHVVETATGRIGKEHITRTRFGATGWLPDSKSFFYLRLPVATAATPVTERERHAKLFLHRLGEAPAEDRLILGEGVDPSVRILPDDIPSLSIAPRSPYVIADLQHGVSNEQTYYAAKITDLLAGQPQWVKLADVSDGVTQADVRGSTIYFLTHKNAPNYSIYAESIAQPDALHRKLVVPAGPSVIQQLGVAEDALYLRVLDAGIGHILRLPFPRAGASPRTALTPLPLPYSGSVIGMTTDPRVPGVTFGLTGWTRSLLWYRTDTPHRRRGEPPLVNTQLKPLSPIDASPYTSLEVRVPSADGTEIPLSIVMKRGLRLDGSHPAYLEGYGAYGMTLDPYFSTTRIAWLERGGIYAVAHVRGGGELGEAWHRAGMRTEKLRSIDDYLACARYLIDQGYTAPAHLGGEGTSAGGIVIGGAITRRPDLFGAALDVVGVSNALRSEYSQNGPANVPEFGSVKRKAEFLTLRAIDAYQQVRDRVRYPAVLIVTGRNDPRVPPWEPAKFAARLQAATSSARPILLRVENDGGHGLLSASRSQSEALLTDEFSFLLWQLGDPAFAPNSNLLAVPEATEPAPERGLPTPEPSDPSGL